MCLRPANTFSAYSRPQTAHGSKLILRKIIKTVATRCHILKLKCSKFDFAGALPQTQLGSLQHSPKPPSWM